MGNNEFRKVHINNRMCYYFDDITKLEDFDLDNILIDKKSYENILIYVISYKTLIDWKPLRIRFDKIDGFFRIYNETRYLTLFGSEKYDAIYHRIRYFINLKSCFTYNFPYYFAKIKVDFYNFLPIVKLLSLCKVIIHIKSVLNKDKNHFYYRTFLENCWK